MLRLCLAFFMLAGLAIAASSAQPWSGSDAVASKCVGADPCRACKSCEHCAYCRGGKTCGACKPAKKTLAEATCF